MNAYTTKGQARIQPSDISTALQMRGLQPGDSIAALERRRGWQAEAEMQRLLKQYGVTPHASTSRVSLMRQRIGAALVRAGNRLTGDAGSNVSVESVPPAGTFGTAS
jgi:hypothetical protein